MKKLTSACVALGLFFSSPKSADGQEESVAPILVSATANQSAETATRQGWPLLIIVSAMHRQLFASEASPVTISGRDGSWSNAVKLEVQNSQGDLVTWPFHLAFTPTGSITLDSETVGELGWWLTPSETAGVPVGDYVITAVVDSTAIESPFASLNPASSVPVRVSMLAANRPPPKRSSPRNASC